MDEQLFKVVVLCLGGIVFPSVAWLVNEVLTLQKDFVTLQKDFVTLQARVEERWESQERLCKEHGKLLGSGGEVMARLDRNVVRLCESSGVKYDSP